MPAQSGEDGTRGGSLPGLAAALAVLRLAAAGGGSSLTLLLLR